ncbi:hypothetical protein [Rossellomorea aquimaris]|uniref:hypothetical protein n=1 Tax=Rossellomorea TaxID=2837508 RepID=UPI001653CD85|nr:hypothetical protein [Rossellomorea aquimaris]
MEGKLSKEFVESEHGEVGLEYFEQIIQTNEKAVVQFAYSFIHRRPGSRREIY